MKRMLVKSLMEPTFCWYSLSGMRNWYHVAVPFSPLRSVDVYTRLSTIWFCPTTMSCGRMLTWYWKYFSYSLSV